MRTAIVMLALSLSVAVTTGAEAARLRFGKRVEPAKARSHVIIVPRLTSSAAAAEPQMGRVPFPAATHAATVQPVSAARAAGSRPWCQSEVVTGGFCVLN